MGSGYYINSWNNTNFKKCLKKKNCRYSFTPDCCGSLHLTDWNVPLCLTTKSILYSVTRSAFIKCKIYSIDFYTGSHWLLLQNELLFPVMHTLTLLAFSPFEFRYALMAARPAYSPWAPLEDNENMSRSCTVQRSACTCYHKRRNRWDEMLEAWYLLRPM